MERAVFNRMHDDAIKGQTTGNEQRCHEVMAQRTDRFRSLEAGHDVMGLALINPDRNLTSAGWIAEQNDRCAACRIQGDTGDAHFNHGERPAYLDYG